MSFAEKIVSEFELAEKNLNGEKESSLFKTRKAAISSFQKFGIPGNRNEEWRYTNIKTQLPENLFIAAPNPAVSTISNFNSFEEITATKLVFINGIFNSALSTIIAEDGVITGSLKDHLKNNSTFTEKYYGKLVNKYEEHFSVLNTAFATDGAGAISPNQYRSAYNMRKKPDDTSDKPSNKTAPAPTSGASAISQALEKK